MKRLLFLLSPLALMMALGLTITPLLCAFAGKGGVTFDDWEETDDDCC